MARSNNIYFTKKIIDSLVLDTINKVSGIDKNETTEIFFNQKNKAIDVKFHIKKDIDNVASVIYEVQNYIFYRLCKMFDINHIDVNVFAE